MKDVIFNVRIERQDYEILRELAKQEHRSMSQLVRIMITKFTNKAKSSIKGA